jgi:hypothetical protein
MTDYYPQEEGAIFDANSYILPCRPDGEITELSSVKMGTTVAGRISVLVSAAFGDGVGIALKASSGAGVPSRIPIIFYGVVKVTAGQDGTVVTSGTFVMNSITTSFAAGDGVGTVAYDNLVVGGGASYIMGLALQTTAAGTDEFLMLVGKTS